MPHDWTTAPEAEWRGFVADHLETMAQNQATLSEKFDRLCEACDERHIILEGRMTKVEVRSGLIASAITIVGGALGWLVGHNA